jgi:two-component system CheB/CheR fusion protein
LNAIKALPVNKKKSKAIEKKSNPPPNPQSPRLGFPIVGIGASAGGLEAVRELLSNLPDNTGMAFVLIQHLDPSHESMTQEILSRTTKMQVCEVQDGMRSEPNHVYVIPPNHGMAISDGVLTLVPRTLVRSQPKTIDFFFQSLAQDQKARAIGVVLSGTASDGTEGVRAIKAEGGFTIAQDPKDAKYDSMPRSAIESGSIDLIVQMDQLAQELVRIAAHPYIATNGGLPSHGRDIGEKEDGGTKQLPLPPDDILRKIFATLRTHSQIDFSNYKPTTLNRRIERRMVVRKTESLADYAKYLRDHPEEVKALFADLLIHVTDFFRDPEAFKALKENVFPNLERKKGDHAPIRVWVPGCSSGEEVYSLAMMLVEFFGDTMPKSPIQIFATDISEQAIQKARQGVYSENIQRSVSKERLSRFFDKVEGGYKINKAVRDLCLFSKHDVTRDPPFAKLDLISCRNVLIYFSSLLQKRVIPIFHYALKPKGVLFLGKSEHPSGCAKMFSLEDKAYKIFSKVDIPTPISQSFPLSHYLPDRKEEIVIKAPARDKVIPDYQKDADQITQVKYSPPGVIVTSELEILQFRGKTAAYLEPAEGSPNVNLLKMAKLELQASLRLTAHAALKQNKSVRKEGIPLNIDGRPKLVNIEVVPTNPHASPKDRKLLIFFETTAAEKPKDQTRGKARSPKGLNKGVKEELNHRIKQLEQENTDLRQYQQSSSEEFEATKEELTSANEELQSTNEEFQSTNEELETAKEELQSSNEELTTVNDELNVRNTELTFLGSDLNNLLVSSEIPILIIGSDRCIRRFTPKAEKTFRLIPSDVGRPIGDLKVSFDLDLDRMVSEVIECLTPLAKEVQDSEGRWMRIQIKPYRTTENKIDGAVIAVLDIDSLKLRLNASDIALKYALSVADAVQLPLVVLGEDLCLKSANLSFFEYFQSSHKSMGTDFFEFLGLSPFQLPKLREALNRSLISDRTSQKFEVDEEFPKIGYRALLVSAKKVRLAETDSEAILVALSDITERKKIEKELAQMLKREKVARVDAEKGNQAKDLFLAMLSHELRTPLTSILSWSQLLRMGKLSGEKANQAASIIESSAKAQGQLISDLLDVSRIIMGKLPMELRDVDPATVIQSALETTRPLAEEKSIEFKTEFNTTVGTVSADPDRLQQVIWNLITNAVKFSAKQSVIEVRLNSVKVDSKDFAEIKVIDSGKGIPKEFLPHIFERFSQAENTRTRTYGGLGLGLAIVRNLIELQGGNVRAESEGNGRGATFTVTIPLATSATRPEAEHVSARHKSPLLRSASENVESLKLGGLRILIVDDEENTREAFSILLKSFDGDVRAASSVSEALIIFREFKPQILVSDIGMPGEDGYSLIQKIRALGSDAGGNVPAIALTAYASGSDVERAYSAGFQEHLSKPVEASDLCRAIIQLVGTENSAVAPR